MVLEEWVDVQVLSPTGELDATGRHTCRLQAVTKPMDQINQFNTGCAPAGLRQGP